MIRLATASDEAEVNRRIRLGTGWADLAEIPIEGSIALLDDDSDAVMLASPADFYEGTPQSDPFWVVLHFHARLRQRRAFIDALANELIRRGRADARVVWQVENHPQLERSVDQLLRPRLVTLQARAFREFTARETKERLRGLR